jgi:putative aldouronate transport system substrate-binding protein
MNAFTYNDPNPNNSTPYLRVNDSGKIEASVTDPNYLEGMTYINRLYKEGLLDKEYLSSKTDKWTALVSANKLGMMLEWPMSGIGNANNELKKIDPSYKFIPILPMKSSDGRRFVDASATGSIVLPRVAITATNKHPVETIKFLDFLYSEAGTELAAFGVKGLHYNIVNGKPVYSEKITNNPEGLNPDMARRKEGINYYFLPFQLGWDSQFQVMEKPSPDVVASWSLYRQPGTIEARMPTLNFTEGERSQETAMNEIIKFVTDKYNPFAVGQEPLDKYDDFVAQIKKMGHDDALKVYNTAYQRYKQYTK